MTQHTGRHKINIHNTSRTFWIFEIKTPFLDSGHKKKTCHPFKALLRRNFDVMFVTKINLYQLIKEDCNWIFDLNEDFHPTNWKKKLAMKSFFFASAIVNLRSSEPAV